MTGAGAADLCTRTLCHDHNMEEPWQLLSEHPGSAGYLSLTARRYQLPDGSQAEWDIFGGDRSVAVLAITDDDQVVLARQYRPGPDRILDELPGGAVEPNEEVTAAASRELLEETGYAGQVEIAGTTWLASACRTKRYVAIARGARRVADPANESGEFCTVVLMPLSGFRGHLQSGQLTDVDLGYLALDRLGRLG
jgi:ADP-ribose pyrophosphatase